MNILYIHGERFSQRLRASLFHPAPPTPRLLARLYRRSCSMNRGHGGEAGVPRLPWTRPTGLETRHYAHDGTPQRNDSRRLRARGTRDSLFLYRAARRFRNLSQRRERAVASPPRFPTPCRSRGVIDGRIPESDAVEKLVGNKYRRVLQR